MWCDDLLFRRAEQSFGGSNMLYCYMGDVLNMKMKSKVGSSVIDQEIA